MKQIKSLAIALMALFALTSLAAAAASAAASAATIPNVLPLGTAEKPLTATTKTGKAPSAMAFSPSNRRAAQAPKPATAPASASAN